MEFERNTPATAQDIALADSPKVTLQPVHGEVRVESTATNYAHQNEAIFEFESEATDAAAAQQPGTSSHHVTAIITAVAIAVIFGGGLSLLYFLR